MHIEIKRSLKKDLTCCDAKEEIFSDGDFLKELNSIISKKKLDAGKADAACNEYLKEIAAGYSKSKIFWSIAETVVRRTIMGGFKKIYYNKENVKIIRDLAKNNLITIVPNHRSVFDFMIIPYILVKETTFMPIILAADVFNVFPLGNIFRRFGAYFVRRSETDELYSLVFRHYVMLIMKYELVHMVFIEGGRNKSGGYSSPKKGILKYIFDGAKKYKIKKDLLFVPVNISYDIVPESHVVIEEMALGRRKHIFSSVISYITKKNLGNCYINFGKPVKMSDFLARYKLENKFIDSLGACLINNIKSLVIVSPISLTSYTLLKSNKIKFSEFKKLFLKNFKALKKTKCNINYIDVNKIGEYVEFADEKGIITFDRNRDLINLNGQQIKLIEYYSNNIAHLF